MSVVPHCISNDIFCPRTAMFNDGIYACVFLCAMVSKAQAANFFFFLTYKRMLFLALKRRKRKPCIHPTRSNTHTSCNARMTLMFGCCVCVCEWSKQHIDIFFFSFCLAFVFVVHSSWKYRSISMSASIRIIRFHTKINSKLNEILCRFSCWTAIN